MSLREIYLNHMANTVALYVQENYLKPSFIASPDDIFMIKENMTMDNLDELQKTLYIFDNVIHDHDGNRRTFFIKEQNNTTAKYEELVEAFRCLFRDYLNTLERGREFIIILMAFNKVDIIAKLLCPPLLQLKENLELLS